MKTKIILELGCNHQGNTNIAKQMIDDAYRLNVYGVKIQKRDINSIPEEVKTKKRDIHNSFGVNYYEHRKALEFSTTEILELKEYAESKGLEFSVTVFDMFSAYEMKDCGIKNIKLPSQLYMNDELNKYILNNFGKTFISTGMHELDEIEYYKYFDSHSVLYYCRSIYPCAINEVCMSKLIYLKSLLTNSSIGYSSHEDEGEAIPFAVLCGAEYIERHYTLDKTMKGSDHATVSSDYTEMERIIKEINLIESVIGEKTDKLIESEKIVRKIYRGF